MANKPKRISKTLMSISDPSSGMQAFINDNSKHLECKELLIKLFKNFPDVMQITIYAYPQVTFNRNDFLPKAKFERVYHK